ncbi:MAG: hypothetical protein E7508_02470 [Ruminococcus sp.]|nr:hypothetical protein [Ruminococcus sp.]
MKKIKNFLSAFFASATATSIFLSSQLCFAEGALYNYAQSNDLIEAYYIIGLESEPLACSQQAKENGVRDYILTEEGQAAYEALMTEHRQTKDDIAKLIGRTPEVDYDYTAAYNGFSMALSYNETKIIMENCESLGIVNLEYGAGINMASAIKDADENDEQSDYSYSDFTEKILEETGVTDSGLNGEGTVIAVIDDEFDLNHEFLTMPEGATGRLTEADVRAVYPYLSAAPYVSKKCYVNEKIPFAFDYQGYDFNTFSKYSSHGTHVAGIAAGNGDSETHKLYDPDGVASNAQLVLLSSVTLSDSNLMAAYDDALYLGADVINASYGSSYTTYKKSVSEYEAIKNITNTGTIFCNAAGNSAKATVATDIFTDYSTSGSPTNTGNVLAVASAENPITKKEYGTLKFTDGSEEAIVNSYDYPISDVYENMEYEYVVVPGYGEQDDYSEIDVADKIALVKLGNTTFMEKISEALSANAAGIIIYNSDDSEIFPIVGSDLPAGMVSYETGMKMIEAEEKTVSFGATVYTIAYNDSISMSNFSSWAFTEQLFLSPDISGFGGNILSSVTDGEILHKSYDFFSGTSMSSPQLTGLNALLKQYLVKNAEKYGIASRCDFTELSAKLLMSTATPVYTSDSLEIASPRVQGNGIANINSAINTPCYISSDSEKDNYRPKISLGDGYRQSYDLTFNVTNISDKDCQYAPSVQLFKDTENENGELAWNTLRLAENEDFTAVFSDNSGSILQQLTVPAGKTIKITAKITLSDEMFNLIKSSGGRFIDGFVRLSCEEQPNLTMSFMAFCGDWSQADEGGIAYDFLYNNPESEEPDAILCDYSLNAAGYNLFDGKISQPCFSPNADGVLDTMKLCMMFKRRCYDLTATIYNSDNKQIYTENLGSGFNVENYDYSIFPNMYDINWDFKENGTIHDNSEYTVEISARLPLSDKMTVIGSCKIKIDNQAPVIKDVSKLTINESEYLVIEAQDNTAIQGALNYSNDVYAVIDEQSANSSVSGKKIIIDISENAADEIIEVYDTAGNYSVVSPDDVSGNLTAEFNGCIEYATTDEDDFVKDKIVFLDENGDEYELDVQTDMTPIDMYEAYGYETTEVTLFIDGFAIYCYDAASGIAGDANTDGKFNVSDAAYIARLLSNKKTDKYQTFLTSIGGYCADYNKDGSVTVSDAATIARHLASRR